MYVSNHFNHCIKLLAPCGPFIDNKKFLFLFLYCPGVDPGFQVRGVGQILKKLRRAEGGANIFGVFRVKNNYFMPKNLIFSNFRGGGGAECAPTGSAPVVYINDNR